jgi:hypothetical protein
LSVLSMLTAELFFGLEKTSALVRSASSSGRDFVSLKNVGVWA